MWDFRNAMPIRRIDSEGSYAYEVKRLIVKQAPASSYRKLLSAYCGMDPRSFNVEFHPTEDKFCVDIYALYRFVMNKWPVEINKTFTVVLRPKN